MTIDINPEFGIELVVGVPYAYWLHKNGQLEKVITSKGMKPFYYFCDDVEEKYDYRTVDNKQAGLDALPNNWIYGFKQNAELYKDSWPDWNKFSTVERGCGILDYRQWEMPNYSEKYKETSLNLHKSTIVVSNRYNYEHGEAPVGYFDIECLYNIFTYLTEKGYHVVYKRPKNTEFPIDQNEATTLIQKYELKAEVQGIGTISDYDLVGYFENVTLLDDIVSDNETLTYNEVQLQLFANAEGFITMGGGSTLFTCLFQKPTVAYYGRAMSEASRDRFWQAEDGTRNIKNYHYMINPNLIIHIDSSGEDMVSNKYSKFLEVVRNTFK